LPFWAEGGWDSARRRHRPDPLQCRHRRARFGRDGRALAAGPPRAINKGGRHCWRVTRIACAHGFLAIWEKGRWKCVLPFRANRMAPAPRSPPNRRIETGPTEYTPSAVPETPGRPRGPRGQAPVRSSPHFLWSDGRQTVFFLANPPRNR
jgi:hypothetical protein